MIKSVLIARAPKPYCENVFTRFFPFLLPGAFSLGDFLTITLPHPEAPKFTYRYLRLGSTIRTRPPLPWSRHPSSKACTIKFSVLHVPPLNIPPPPHLSPASLSDGTVPSLVASPSPFPFRAAKELPEPSLPESSSCSRRMVFLQKLPPPQTIFFPLCLPPGPQTSKKTCLKA